MAQAIAHFTNCIDDLDYPEIVNKRTAINTARSLTENEISHFSFKEDNDGYMYLLFTEEVEFTFDEDSRYSLLEQFRYAMEEGEIEYISGGVCAMLTLLPN
jgi:hypothetical protein